MSFGNFSKGSEDDEDDKKNPFNPWMFLAIIIVALGMMVVFIVGMLNSSIAIAIGGFLGGAAIIIVLMFIMVFKPAKNKEPQINESKKAEIEKLKYSDTISSSVQKEQIDWYKTKSLIFTDNIEQEDKNCPICKIPIKKEETFVMSCPQCLSLFHGEHLIEWVLEHSRCPVCSFEIDVKK